MSELLKLYRKKLIMKSAALADNALIDRKLPSPDLDFNNKPGVLELYDSSAPLGSSISGGTLLNTYYKQYGYTSLIGAATGYLTGINSPTNLLQHLVGSIVPGATRGGIGSVLLRATNIALRNPFIESTINNALGLPSIIGEGFIKNQHIPSQLFLAVNPPPLYVSNADPLSLTNSIITSTINSVFASTLSGLTNSGTLTGFDAERAFGRGIDAAEVILLARAGIKYTRAAAWYDPTRRKWANDPGFYTYDKYIAYSDGAIVYSNSREIYGDTMLSRYHLLGQYNLELPRFIPGNLGTNTNAALPNVPLARPGQSKISENINKANAAGASSAKLYQQSLGKAINANANPELLYSNKEEIRTKINRLGFPLYNLSESLDRGSNEYLDRINMLDVGEDYPDGLADNIIFKFEDISSVSGTSIPLIFRATISGLAHNISPEWDGIKYLGRPDKFYLYTGLDRKLSFEMKVYTNSELELPTQWRKINRLAGLCYPVSYYGNRTMKAPIIRLTIGDMYRRIYGFIDSFDLSVVDEGMWDTEDEQQLPQIVNISIAFTIIYEGDGAGAPITNAEHFKQGGKFKNNTQIIVE